MSKTTRELLASGAELRHLLNNLNAASFDGRGHQWLMDLYRSQMICTICGTPFFATHTRAASGRREGDTATLEPVCSNTCTQQRRRGTRENGWWWGMATNSHRHIDRRTFPRTIGELLDHEHLADVRDSIPFLVIDLDDTPPAPPAAVIELDDSPIVALEQRLNARRSEAAVKGVNVTPAVLFPDSQDGLDDWLLAVDSYGFKEGAKKASATHAGKVLGLVGKAMQNRGRRLKEKMAGKLMK